MIELELKYKLSILPQVFSDFERIKKKEQSDIYYDTKNYDLLRAGNFLRVRNGKKIDFKMDIDDETHLFCLETSFFVDEINKKMEEIEKTMHELGIDKGVQYADLNEFITKNELEVLAVISKERSSYQLNTDTTLSIDNVEDLGLYLEIETLIEAGELQKDEAEKYKEKLIEVLNIKGIISDKDEIVNIGYVELYLQKYNMEAYKLGKFQE